MPLFSYQCESCETVSELLVRGTEAPVCPQCGSKKMIKQQSAFAPMASQRSEAAPACSAGPGACCSGGSCPYN